MNTEGTTRSTTKIKSLSEFNNPTSLGSLQALEPVKKKDEPVAILLNANRSHHNDEIVEEKPKETPEKTTPPNQEDEENLDDLNTEASSSSSGGVLISVTINILFIVSFLLEFGIRDASEMNLAIAQEFDKSPISINPEMFLTDLSRIEEVQFFIQSVILNNLLNPNRAYTPRKYANLQNKIANLHIAEDNRTDIDILDINVDEFIPPSNYSSSTYSDVPSYYFLNSFNLFKGMLIFVEYDPNIQMNTSEPAPVSIFLNATVSQAEANQTLAPLLVNAGKARLAEGVITEVKFHTIFFNVITQVGLFYDMDCIQADASNFGLAKSVKPFFPKVFDGDTQDSTAQLLILVFRVLFALSLVFRIIKIIIIDLYKAVKTFFQTQKLVLPLTLVFNICVLGLLMLILVLSVIHSINQGGTFETFAVVDQETFETFIGFADFLTVFLKLLAISVAFQIVQILLLLNTQFPTFGVLFYTLNNSKNKLLIYGVLIVTLMAGFIVFLTLNFGPYDSDMNNIGDSLLLIFEFMIGVVDLEKLNAANKYLAWIYFFVFYLIFNLLILLLFIVIIISTYIQLRKKLQITTLALAELAAEKSNKLKEKYINLLLFRVPDDQNAENKKRHGKKNTQKKKKNLFEILIYNLEEVDWFGFTNNNRQTRDEIEDEIKAKISEIKKRKLEQKKKKMQDRKNELFENILNIAIHVVFIIIYTYMVTYELKIDYLFEINKTLENYFVKTTFKSQCGLMKTFNDITTLEDIRNWSKDVYFGKIYQNFGDNDVQQTTIIRPYDQNAIITSAASRVTIRNLVAYSKSEGENNTFYLRVPNDVSSSTVPDVLEKIELSESIFAHNYINPGNYLTFRQNGGFFWVFPRDVSEARMRFNEIINPLVLNIDTGLVNFQTVYMNRNYELLGVTEFTFTILSTGSIEKEYKTRGLRVDLYTCDNCQYTIVFEVIFVLFILKQTFNIIKKWINEWKTEESARITPLKHKFQNGPWYVKMLNHEIEGAKFSSILWSALKRIWQLSYRIVITTLNLFKKNYANLVLAIQLVLTYWGFALYLQILLNKFRQDLDLNATPKTIPEDLMAEEIGKYEELALLFQGYALVQAFNSWFIILRLLFQYGFSKELSLVIELIYEAMLDIIFFTAMFVIILLGFSVDGYLLFGTEAASFSTIPESLLQVLLIMVSGESPDDLLNVDKITKAIYYILLVVICLLILIKMFIAILDGYFTDLTSDNQFQDNLGVFELILTIVIQKVKNAEVQEITEKYPDNAGRITRLKVDTIIYLKKLRNFGLERLKQLIGEEESLKKKQVQQQVEENKVDVNLDFVDDKDERRDDLREIQIYLNDGEPEVEKEHQEERSIEQNENVDDLTIPSKWMSHLEEALLKITNGKISLTKYGTGAKDYLALEKKIDPDLMYKFNQIEETCNKNRPSNQKLTTYYTTYVAIPDYHKARKKFKGKSFYQGIADQLYFIFYKSLTKSDEKKSEQDEREEEEELIEEEKQIVGGFSRLQTKGNPSRNFEFKRRRIYKESRFHDPENQLIKFWETLKFKHRHELWAGEQMDLLTNDLRSCLWKQMKFSAATFGKFTEYLVTKNLIEPEEPEENGEIVQKEQIGMKELEYIWKSLYDDIDQNADERQKEKSSEDRINVKHIQLIEQVIRGSSNNIVFELGKFETTKEKLNFLSSLKNIKNDSKLKLWLLTPINLKMEMILRIENEVLLDFSMLLLMEEIYDNAYLLQKIEKNLDTEMKNRIYMHFFYFANYEASQYSLKNFKDDIIEEEDPDLVEYIQFLEAQAQSTNLAKKNCLEEIQKVLKKEELYRSQLELKDEIMDQKSGGEKMISQQEDEKEILIGPQSEIDLKDESKSEVKSRVLLDEETYKDDKKENIDPENKQMLDRKIGSKSRSDRLANLKKKL